jgi:hypothetical protein
MALDVTPGGSASDSYLSLADALSFANGDLGGRMDRSDRSDA